MSASPKLAPHGPLSLVLATLTAGLLGFSAFAHFKNAKAHTGVPTDGLSGPTVFRLQAIGCVAAALLLLACASFVTGRLALLGWVGAAGMCALSLGGVLSSRYGNFGKVLFLPDLDETSWTDLPYKIGSAICEGIGICTALAGLGATWMALRYTEKKRASAGSAVG